MQVRVAGEATRAAAAQPWRFRSKKVKDLMADNKRRLVEVPHTASIADTMTTLLANGVVAVPVAAPPGHWIGAGGSMIMESDKRTGAARKHYIGMVTMLDVMAHIAELGDLDRTMDSPVSSIIGKCLESLSLWTLNSNTDITDCMEVFSKGIHRALVPVDGEMAGVIGGELADSASSYRMVTQMDLLKFLKSHSGDLRGVLDRPVGELGAVGEVVFGVSDKAKVINIIKCMNGGSLNAMPIVESNDDDSEEDHSRLMNGKGRKIVGTFSTTDLRGCPMSLLQTCLEMNVMDFVEGLGNTRKEPVTCLSGSVLGEVVDKVVNNHVHRAWVVDEMGLLVGLISLTDIIGVTRVWLLSEGGG